MNRQYVNAGFYVESDHIFPDKLCGEVIPNLVRHLDAQNALISLAKVVWSLEDNHPFDKQVQSLIAYHYLHTTRHDIASQLIESGAILYFRPQIHITMKYITRFSRINDPLEPVEGDLLYKLGTAVHAATDLIAKQSVHIRRSLERAELIEQITLQLVTGEHLLTSSIPMLAIARSKMMYEYIHSRLNESTCSDYLDIDAFMRDAIGLSIQQYLHIGFGFIINMEQFRHSEFVVPDDPNFIEFHPKAYFSTTHIHDYDVLKLFEFISHSITDLGSFFETQNQRQTSYDFIDFQLNPLIRIDTDSYIPVSFDYVVERLTTGIYWILFDLLRELGDQNLHLKFSRYNGKLFEIYIVDLARSLFDRIQCENKSFYSDELYNIGKQKLKTSDAIIITDNLIILFEVTASRITATNTKVEGKKNAFIADCEKMEDSSIHPEV